ncbi:MAG TPA: hypothetical protein VKB80_35545 [Kofleriaceae bacterium]|nr:hypothetical protein [Kofleriaceae bacterium]
MSVSGRAFAVLGRFPRHLAVDDPDKLFAAVVDGLARPLDVQTAQVGGVRRAHRLGHADEHTDLLRLAALHRLREVDVELASLRLAAIAGARGVLAGAPGDTDEALDHLAALLGAAREELEALADLPAALAPLLAYPFEVELVRARIAATVRAHRQGNGTVSALLSGAANALDLDVEAIRHLEGGFWHEARCSDRIRLDEVDPQDDLLFLEENPLRPAELAPAERKHGEKFLIRRAGFDAVATDVRVVGVQDRTMVPMVVQRDAGFGLVFAGAVPDGKELLFGRDGAALLDGADVTRFGWAFRGAVYTDPPTGPAPHPGDFLFADEGGGASDRTARFAVTLPATDAFDPSFEFPRADGPVDSPSLAVGETRWAFFVRVAHHGAVFSDGAEPAVPFALAGVFDGSVWAGDGSPTEAAAKVGFAWDEREPFSVKVWLPNRFGELDGGGAPPASERVRAILDRHRAAGVHVYVSLAGDQVLPPPVIPPEE